MQPKHMRSVTFVGKFTSGSRISASRSDLLKLPIGCSGATAMSLTVRKKQVAKQWRQQVV